MVDQKLNIFGAVDEDKERAAAYQDAVKRYPMGKGTCDILVSSISSLQAEIDKLTAQKVNDAGKAPVLTRTIDGLAKRQTDFQKVYATQNCEQLAKDTASQSMFNNELGILDRAKSLTSAASSTTKYVVLGMLGLVVVVAGIVIIKKLRK